MTRRRYLSYRWALHRIDGLEEGSVEPAVIGELRQTAEDLLLSRTASREVEELAGAAAATLERLTASGAITPPVATDMWRALCGSGPATPRVAAPSSLVLAA